MHVPEHSSWLLSRWIRRPYCWLYGHDWLDEGDGKWTPDGMLFGPEYQRWSCPTCELWYRGERPKHWRRDRRQ